MNVRACTLRRWVGLSAGVRYDARTDPSSHSSQFYDGPQFYDDAVLRCSIEQTISKAHQCEVERVDEEESDTDSITDHCSAAESVVAWLGVLL